MAGPIASTESEPPSPAPVPSDPANDSGPAPGAPSNGATARAADEGFTINLGRGITINPDELAARVNLEDKRQPIPGLTLKQLRYNQRRRTATVIADIDIPHVRSPRNGIRVSINAEGETTLDATLTSDLPIFKNKRLQLTLDEQNNLATTLVIEAADLTPRRRIRGLTATGGGTFHLANGMLSGNVNADLAYDKLGDGHFEFNFSSEGRASGNGTFNFSDNYLNGAQATLEVDEEANLKAEVAIPVSEINTGIPGLSITEGTVRFTMDNSTPGGALEAVKLNYNGIGEATVNARIRNGQFTGSGTFGVTLSELSDVSGRLRYSNGVLTGSATIRSRDFPRALGVQSGSITITLLESGDVDYSGTAIVRLGPAGTGELHASKEGDVHTISATITLENIPGLQSSEFKILFTSEGKIEGAADIATDENVLGGFSATVHVEYKDNLWSGESTVTYTKDDPTLNGNVTIRVRQTEEGTLVFSGEGDISAEVTDGIEGTVGVAIDEESNITLTMDFMQTIPHELFPEFRRENEFLNISQNIPLWAGIVVAVIRIRAGARAGIGPGQLRNTHVTGTWIVTNDEPPDMSISTEFFMPAFVEGYVAFGAGLGVDVVLGSLTGGIEAMATAGLYGAVSVIPQLTYENGEWSFDGTATLAAGARLKLSLNAWAEVEALWVTVWDRTWELASHTMNIGPDLVLTAGVSMNLSNPSVPELTFESSDTDNRGLIDSAMPEDGPPSAGTREALENRAEWSGQTEADGPAADSVPSELASQASANEPDAPAAPARPQRPSGPPAGGDPSSPAGNTATPGSQPPGNQTGTANAGAAAPGSGNQPATDTGQGNAAATGPGQAAAPESEVLGTDQPRYQRPVTLETLNEPPAPMPRTAAQQREDLDAAARVFDLAAAQVEDSEQLATYFQRIRRRFQLTTIGYVTVGDNAHVEISINPKVTKLPVELAKGRGIAGKTSSINYRPGTLAGSSDTVGLEMVADPLGPDHPAGSGPSGQSNLMGQLETDPELPAQQKFIRGHLLNDRIGGEGTARNLFPITAAANRAHEQQIESRVKTWVNSNRYWVFYKVRVSVGDVSLQGASKKSSNKVNSRFVCEASVYDLQGNKKNTIRASIISNFRAPPSDSVVSHVSGPDQASEVAVSTRAADRSATIERSSREDGRVYSLNTGIRSDLRTVKGKRKTWAQIRERLSSIPGVGEGRLDTLQEAYRLSARTAGKDIGDDLGDPGEKSNLTFINGIASAIHTALSVWL